LELPALKISFPLPEPPDPPRSDRELLSRPSAPEVSRSRDVAQFERPAFAPRSSDAALVLAFHGVLPGDAFSSALDLDDGNADPDGSACRAGYLAGSPWSRGSLDG
jgi:hypothetical protein